MSTLSKGKEESTGQANNEYFPERDLSFQRVVNPNPKKLTPEQIEFFNENGYLKPFRIFDEQQVTAHRAYFDGLLESIKKLNDGRDTYAINGYQNQCRGIYDIAVNPLILDYVEDLLGPNIVTWGTHFFCKPPHESRQVPWHQDAAYWPFDKSRTVTAWLAIDDADTENACMQVIPGTHKMGQLEWKDASKDSVLTREIVDIDQYGKPVPFELKAGEISLHADMLAHGSGANHSSRRRGGLTIRYCPVEVRALTDWNSVATICRGSDPSGHWANNPCPEGEDLSPRPFQKKILAGG